MQKISSGIFRTARHMGQWLSSHSMDILDNLGYKTIEDAVDDYDRIMAVKFRGFGEGSRKEIGKYLRRIKKIYSEK